MTIALAFALTSVPAFLIAGSLARSHARELQARGHAGPSALLARLMRVVGVVLLVGAGGMLWADGNDARTLLVAVALAFAVNGLAVLMLVAVLRSRRGGPR